jgi:hypothetical protein
MAVICDQAWRVLRVGSLAQLHLKISTESVAGVPGAQVLSKGLPRASNGA